MVSEQFGEMGCSTHSPSLDRPGHLSEEIRDGFRECGFELATAAVRFPSRALIETFTHPALLSLMNASYRIPYKVGKTKCYWPNAVREERLVKVREQLERIWRALSKHIDKLDFSIPDTAESFSALKPLEDKIDALVCAWVGIKVLEGHAVAIGDDNAAIWLPRPNDWSELFATDAAASSQFMEGVEDLPVQERAIFAPDADLPLRARRTVAVNRSR